jgi:hypothetical protein
MRRQGSGKADGGEARHGGDGEQASGREGETKGESRPTRNLTPRPNFGDGSRQQRSGEAAAATAAEVRWRWLVWLGFCEARRRL